MTPLGLVLCCVVGALMWVAILPWPVGALVVAGAGLFLLGLTLVAAALHLIAEWRCAVEYERRRRERMALIVGRLR